MCQIFAGNSKQIRSVLLGTKDLLDDLYTSNPDGIGAMYATSKHKLRTPKIVPRSLDDAFKFVRQLPDDDRNIVVHFRWKTSGNVDTGNAHPFDVLPGQIAMTHNGVLGISTKSDTTKCDTRHYIEAVLRPQLATSTELLRVEAWRNLVGEDIGTGNRFVFMDNKGEMFFVNRETGIEHDGMWIANTYSFDASLLIPGYHRKSFRGWKSIWPDDDGVEYLGTGQFDEAPANEGLDDRLNTDDVWVAIGNCDADEMADLLLDYPLSTLDTLFKSCDFIPLAEEGAYSPGDEFIVKMLTDKDAAELAKYMRVSDSRAEHVAEVICWYGDWVGLAETPEPDEPEEHVGEVRPRVRAITAPVSASTDAKWSAASKPVLVQ